MYVRVCVFVCVCVCVCGGRGTMIFNTMTILGGDTVLITTAPRLGFA